MTIFNIRLYIDNESVQILVQDLNTSWRRTSEGEVKVRQHTWGTDQAGPGEAGVEGFVAALHTTGCKDNDSVQNILSRFHFRSKQQVIFVKYI